MECALDERRLFEKVSGLAGHQHPDIGQDRVGLQDQLAFHLVGLGIDWIAGKSLERDRLKIDAKPSWHVLRHTGAVWAAEAGISMPELAQFMGHDDDRTTQKHYARCSPDYLVQVANAAQRVPESGGGSE
jgi:integrase